MLHGFFYIYLADPFSGSVLCFIWPAGIRAVPLLCHVWSRCRIRCSHGEEYVYIYIYIYIYSYIYILIMISIGFPFWERPRIFSSTVQRDDRDVQTPPWIHLNPSRPKINGFHVQDYAVKLNQTDVKGNNNKSLIPVWSWVLHDLRQAEIHPGYNQPIHIKHYKTLSDYIPTRMTNCSWWTLEIRLISHVVTRHRVFNQDPIFWDGFCCTDASMIQLL